MEISIAQIIGPVYLVVGLSVLIYVKVWQRLFEKWAEDHVPMLSFMFMYLVFGVLIVNLYNVWAWNVWLLVTLTGWALIVKSVAYFLLPGVILKKCLVFKKQAWVLYVGGVMGVVLGAVLSYFSYFA